MKPTGSQSAMKSGFPHVPILPHRTGLPYLGDSMSRRSPAAVEVTSLGQLADVLDILRVSVARRSFFSQNSIFSKPRPILCCRKRLSRHLQQPWYRKIVFHDNAGENFCSSSIMTKIHFSPAVTVANFLRPTGLRKTVLLCRGICATVH